MKGTAKLDQALYRISEKVGDGNAINSSGPVVRPAPAAFVPIGVAVMQLGQMPED